MRLGDWMESPDLAAGFLRALAPYLIGVCLFRYTVQPRVPGWTGVFALPVVLIGFTQMPETFRLVVFSLIAAPILLLGSLQLKSRFGRALGRMSYPLYAVHVPLICLGSILGLGFLTIGFSITIVVLAIIWFEDRVIHHRRPVASAGRTD